jgi:CRP/FNR family transcriptional regulator, anaerobic regulatory protein
MDKLKAFVYAITQPTETEWLQFATLVKTQTVEKGKNIIKAATRCDRMYFICTGIVRYMMLANGKEKTIDIAMDNDLVTDFYGFYSGAPAICSVQAITSVELHYLTTADLEQLYQSAAIWERFGRLLAQKGLLDQILVKLDLQTKTAEQRYKELIARKPNLLEEVNLGIIAACLNITQETLSRIRGRT